MKLKNKKTGAVANYRIILQRETGNGSNEAPIRYGCGSLAKLNEDWEDYEPKEPLIKDEKVRKAVRAWAEANGLEDDYTVKYCSISFTLTSWQADIEFNKNIEDLEEGKEYTITELCGEDEA